MIPCFVSDVVAAYAQVNHYNYSTAHAHALILNFMLPYYIEIESPVLLEGPPLCSEVTEEGVKFHVSFRENTSFTLMQ